MTQIRTVDGWIDIGETWLTKDQFEALRDEFNRRWADGPLADGDTVKVAGVQGVFHAAPPTPPVLGEGVFAQRQSPPPPPPSAYSLPAYEDLRAIGRAYATKVFERRDLIRQIGETIRKLESLQRQEQAVAEQQRAFEVTLGPNAQGFIDAAMPRGQVDLEAATKEVP